MPERDGRDVVLQFLAETGIPLPPKGIYGGLIYTRDITFSYRFVEEVIREFRAAGWVERVEIDSAAGEVRPIPEDARGRKGYYVITDAGREELSQRLDS